MARKFTHVSLGACLGPMPGTRTNYNCTRVLARPQKFGISVFISPLILNSPEIHQRWHGVTSWHIYVVVKTLSNLGQALLQTSYKPELLSKKPRCSDRETCSPCGRNIITSSFRL